MSFLSGQGGQTGRGYRGQGFGLTSNEREHATTLRASGHDTGNYRDTAMIRRENGDDVGPSSWHIP